MDEKVCAAARQRQTIRERAKIAAAVLFGLVCGISCLSIDLGSHSVEMPLVGTLKQEGTLNNVTSAPGPVEVYYPRPYMSPPNLEVTSSDSFWPALDSVEVLEQKADHFTFHRKSSTFPVRVVFKWKAEGVPVGLPLIETTKAPPAPINDHYTKTSPPPEPLTPADAIPIETGGK